MHCTPHLTWWRACSIRAICDVAIAASACRHLTCYRTFAVGASAECTVAIAACSWMATASAITSAVSSVGPARQAHPHGPFARRWWTRLQSPRLLLLPRRSRQRQRHGDQRWRCGGRRVRLSRWRMCIHASSCSASSSRLPRRTACHGRRPTRLTSLPPGGKSSRRMRASRCGKSSPRVQTCPRYRSLSGVHATQLQEAIGRVRAVLDEEFLKCGDCLELIAAEDVSRHTCRSALQRRASPRHSRRFLTSTHPPLPRGAHRPLKTCPPGPHRPSPNPAPPPHPPTSSPSPCPRTHPRLTPPPPPP